MVRQLMPDCDVRFLQSQYGSGKGAAMVTAVAYRCAAQQAERQAVLDNLCLSREQLLEVKKRMWESMSHGLSEHTHKESSVKMLPTYVRSTPDGTGDLEEAVRAGMFTHCLWNKNRSIFFAFFFLRTRRLLGCGPWRLQLPGGAGTNTERTKTKCQLAPEDLSYPTGDLAGYRGRGKEWRQIMINVIKTKDFWWSCHWGGIMGWIVALPWPPDVSFWRSCIACGLQRPPHAPTSVKALEKCKTHRELDRKLCTVKRMCFLLLLLLFFLFWTVFIQSQEFV